MDKNFLMAMLLSMGVITSYFLLFPPPEQLPVTKEQSTPPAETAAVQQPVGGTGQTRAGRIESSQKGAVPPAREIEIDTPRYQARIDARGGRLVSFRLKNYKTSKTAIDWGDVLPFLREYFEKPVLDPDAAMEMVQDLLRETDALDVTFVDNPRLSLAFRNTVFSSDRARIRLSEEGDQPRTLVLTGRGPGGVTISKRLTFHADSYIIDYEMRVLNYGDSPQQLRVVNRFGEGPVVGPEEDNLRSFHGPIFREDDSVDIEDSDDIEGRLVLRNPQWLGITSNYFITAAAAESRIDHAEFRSAKTRLADGDEKWLASYGVELPAVLLQPENMIAARMRLYLGPKQREELEKFEGELEASIKQTFQWLGPLARGLLAIMHWLQNYTGNYGLSIILLTVLVRVGLFPLTYKGMVSMRRMSKLQPKMKSLREKYGQDKERLNREMMEMYKRYRINPLGGCLPILVQMPIFFALYSALLSAIELRHAPFFWWIQDLSAMDPLFITPLLMGATMYLQQKFTPTAMDPAQQRVLMLMPLVFMVFMFTFPAGLVLYWATSNVLSIVQQIIINRVNVPEPEEVKR